ncbi:hypothetical protein FA95DRAFT_1496860 [Auriscalpium vulgare]|uniref:Uncharacterized protein n=1 Tax=Auriscalpium vulgare TaxID=40419 RepID=A0ACB8RKX9_9AGAM|nr:hypothetical protein FA95DRAFT_1496860 [Auriscalpium vulgare]
MEKVHFQQEQMLAELKDLVQKGLFTQSEIKEIMKKRTAFETALVRRVAKKGDFLRYAAYEMGLETLRKKRVERLKIPPGPPSISDYALVRRQFYIFERALKKFKSDVGLWVQYIEVAKRENARTLVGRITARALQLHPNTPALYVLAAAHELDHLSPSTARTLLQRGIRLNGESVAMWREYVKMELGFVESLRRRWDLLGIELDGKGKGTSPPPPLDDAVDDEVEGDAARIEIMNGAIVKSVITSAAKALPKIELFTALQHLISTYPSPEPLRAALLAHLHDELAAALPRDPEAVTLRATHALSGDPSGGALIDALKRANEALLEAQPQESQTAYGRGLSDAYAAFVREWCAKPIDDHLKTYLVASLRAQIRRLSEPPPSLLAAHVRLMSTASPAASPEKILRTARKYTALQRRAAGVWLARLDAEAAHASATDVRAAWAEARANVDAEDVWLWGVRGIHASEEERVAVLEVRAVVSQRNRALC